MHVRPGHISAHTFELRRERVRAQLGEGVLVLVGAPARYRSRDVEYPFRPDSDLYYLTGLTEPDAVAVLSGGGEGGGLELFVRARDARAELWSGPRLGPEAASEFTGARRAHTLSELSKRLPALLERCDSIYFRLGERPSVEPLVLDALRRARIRGARSGEGPRRVADPGLVIDEVRLRKDPEEIDLMRRAAELTVAGFAAMAGVLRAGAGEWQLQAALESAFREAGGDGPAYETIVASGPNACVLHHVANDRTLEQGDLVLIDAGAAVGLYAADVTRTLPVGGAFGEVEAAVYEVVEAARRAAVATVAPGADVASVHEAAVQVLVEGLVDLGVLQGPAGDLGEGAHTPFFPHQTSHWLGLDVHDVGDYAVGGRPRLLEPGMVLTVEPGLYFGPSALASAGESAARFEGLGVRIEDDVLVTREGGEVLTSGIPTDPSEVAALVADTA